MAVAANEDDNPITQEFELLASIFCLEDESCDLKTMFPNYVISVIQTVCDKVNAVI